jgi:transcriptional regulator, deoR family
MRRIRSRIEKGALAQAAAYLVSAGNAVIIDDSSTALPMVPELAKVNPLTVITNSMPVARSLAASKNTELVLIGGRYYPWAEAFYGSLGTGFVKNLRADLCFMSDAAVWYDGVYNPTDYVTDMKRTMLEQSFHRVLMIDNSKFARRAWQKTTSLATFETILVDDGATEQQLDMLAASGAEVTVVPVPGR